MMEYEQVSMVVLIAMNRINHIHFKQALTFCAVIIMNSIDVDQ